MYILYPRDDGEKPVSDFLKSGVPAIIASVMIVGSLIACFVIRRKAKKKQEAEDAALGMGRESLDLELDAGPIYAQKPISTRSLPQFNNNTPSPASQSQSQLHDPPLPRQQQHRRQASRPGMHSRSTSVSLGYSGSEEGPFNMAHSDRSAEELNGAQVYPSRGSSKKTGSQDMGRGLLSNAEPMGRM